MKMTIGHNNPPDDLVEIQVIEELKSDAIALWTEFEKPNPSIALVKRWGASLQSVAAGSIKWIGRKADLAVDTAIKTVVPLAVTGVGVAYNEPLHKVLDALISWLSLVAKTVL